MPEVTAQPNNACLEGLQTRPFTMSKLLLGVSHCMPPYQVTPLTREHSKEVADLFNPAKAAERTAAEASAALSSTSGAAGELRPVLDVYALGDCCANTGMSPTTTLRTMHWHCSLGLLQHRSHCSLLKYQSSMVSS